MSRPVIRCRLCGSQVACRTGVPLPDSACGIHGADYARTTWVPDAHTGPDGQPCEGNDTPAVPAETRMGPDPTLAAAVQVYDLPDSVFRCRKCGAVKGDREHYEDSVCDECTPEDSTAPEGEVDE